MNSSRRNVCLEFSNVPEEVLIRLLRFSGVRKIVDFLTCHPTLDLHYPKENLSTPLTTAIERSDPLILSMLIDKIPVDLDDTLTQPCGKTALMHAAYCTDNPDLLQVLIRKGADPNKTDMHGWNCLFYAIIGRRLKNVIGLLSDKTISIESRDADGRTPLMISVYLSSYEVFDQLIKMGADVDAIDQHDLSVLHIAILKRSRDCVIALTRLCRDGRQTRPDKISTLRLARELLYDLLPVEANFRSNDDNNDEEIQ